MDRPEIVSGTTYKITPSKIDSAIYITINNIEINGKTRPIEVFINCKDMESYQWISCTTKLLSAILRHDGEFPAYAIQELLDTHDPTGGYIVPKSGGYFAPSIVAHIGWIIKRHCVALELMSE